MRVIKKREEIVQTNERSTQMKQVVGRRRAHFFRGQDSKGGLWICAGAGVEGRVAGMCAHMYQHHYDDMKAQNGDTCNFEATDTDSFSY